MYPKYSFIVQTFNSSNYVLQTLESLLQQTVLPSEVVIVDDCSHDNTLELINGYINQNKIKLLGVDFIIIGNKQRIGTCKSLYLALSRCSCNYIKPIAGDDILLPLYSETALTILASCNYKAYVSSINIIDANSQIIAHPLKHVINSYLKLYKNLPHSLKLMLILTRMNIPTVSAFYSLDILKECLNTSVILIEDWPLWIKIFTLQVPVFFDNCSYVSYRIHPDQATLTKSDDFAVIARDNDGRTINGLRFRKSYPFIVKISLYIDNLLSSILCSIPFLSFKRATRNGLIIHPLLRLLFMFYFKNKHEDQPI